jgi:hypothetical protein
MALLVVSQRAFPHAAATKSGPLAVCCQSFLLLLVEIVHGMAARVPVSRSGLQGGARVHAP